jgi:hypothetical protein
LFESPADWISPTSAVDYYRNDPPAAKGNKVIMTDTDHLWGVGGDRGWVWKSFVRGLNPIYMDPFEDQEWRSSAAKFEACRQAMGDTLAYARRIKLATAVPHGELASSGYCLATPGDEYLVYIPFRAPAARSNRLEAQRFRFFSMLRNPIRNLLWQFKRDVTINLSNGSGKFLVEWFNPSRAETIKGRPVEGGKTCHFETPFSGDAVLYLRKSPGRAEEG